MTLLYARCKAHSLLLLDGRLGYRGYNFKIRTARAVALTAAFTT